ncbi:MAG: glycosyltransferase family 39 protein [Halobacteriota archaeon]
MLRERIKSFLSIDRVILLSLIFLQLLLTLNHITSPFLDYHAWRQADTAAIARNFYHNGFNILYPQIDWGGAGPGYVETEFQLVPFLTAVLYQLFGVHDYVARLVAISFSILSIYLIYKLSYKYFTRNVAIFSALFFIISPLNVYTSRSFQPESAMVFFSLGSLYFFDAWIEKERWGAFALASFCTTAAFLVKIPTIFLGVPLLWLVYTKYRWHLFKEWKLYLFAALALIPPILWYYHAHLLFLHYGNTFGIWTLTDTEGWNAKWGSLEIWFSSAFYNNYLLRLSGIVLTPIGFTLFILGVFQKVKSRREYVFHFWLLSILIYFIVLARGNWIHDYYQLPLVPVAAIFMGKALAMLLGVKQEKKIGVFALLAVTLLMSVSIFLPPLYKIDDAQHEAGPAIDKLTPKGALIIAGDGYAPTLLYYANRKGWLIAPEEWTPHKIETLKEQGANYFVTSRVAYLKNDVKNKQFYDYMSEKFPVVEGTNYIIFNLTNSNK